MEWKFTSQAWPYFWKFALAATGLSLPFLLCLAPVVLIVIAVLLIVLLTFVMLDLSVPVFDAIDTFASGLRNQTSEAVSSCTLDVIRWYDVLYFLIISTLLVIALICLFLICFGFGTGGIVAGSCAAAIMTPITAAGSWFALFQSLGALGVLCWGAFINLTLVFVFLVLYVLKCQLLFGWVWDTPTSSDASAQNQTLVS